MPDNLIIRRTSVRYVIVASPEPDAEILREMPAETLLHDVGELAGRSVTPWLGTCMRRKGICYVATARDSEGRTTFGQGFIVRKLQG